MGAPCNFWNAYVYVPPLNRSTFLVVVLVFLFFRSIVVFYVDNIGVRFCSLLSVITAKVLSRFLLIKVEVIRIVGIIVAVFHVLYIVF